MKHLVIFLFLSCLYFTFTNAAQNLVCYYNSASYTREGQGKLSNPDLEIALPFCSHLVYGYVGIRNDNFKAESLNDNLDIQKLHFSEITSLKRKYPHLKVLLSVGGDHDIDENHPDKYLELLEGGKDRQKEFIQSAFSLVKNYGFDGLDLAYQFPRNKPRKVHGAIGSFFKSLKKPFTGDFVVDPKAAEHKEQFTSFVHDVKDALRPSGFLLSLTVLPNVNSTWYFNIPALAVLIDFVNLAAFDFVTPERNPEEADYSASLHYEDTQNRLPHYNADFQAKYWLQQGFPSKKINLGVTSYGNTWKLTSSSGKKGTPVVSDTEGPALEGPYSKKAGLLSYPEICTMLASKENHITKDSETGLRQASFGNYAFRAKKGSETEGIWISYDDINTISHKASYAEAFLGGVALFDLGYDDFRGLCTGAKYPVLRIINQNLRDFSNKQQGSIKI